MKKTLNMPILVLTLLLLSVGTCLGLGVFAHYFNRDLYRATKEVSANWIPSITLLSNMRADMNRVRRAEAHAMFNSEACSVNDCTAAILAARRQLETTENAYKPLVGQPEEHILFDSYQRQRAIYLHLQDELLQEKKYDAPVLQRFLGESSVSFEATLDILGQLIEFNSRNGEASQAAVQTYYSSSQTYIYLSNVILSITAALIVMRLLILFIS